MRMRLTFSCFYAKEVEIGEGLLHKAAERGGWGWVFETEKVYLF